ncbi:glucokinase [Asticcacaulis sp. AC466]|uniref:glucokinase n=1 Tax=Asticcacaulis sp. AC466 TaxID=1282362 RepID=UPI0003C3CA85|nr:glucokinase [Asticcacaulis sp. AC466]ESQ86103.1 glucokinase [Asticcacaulis sp. AC466]
MTAHFDSSAIASGRTLRGLVGDIGGTNARFAIAERTNGKTKLSSFKSLETADHKDVYDALTDYFRQIGGKPELDYTVVAVAGPVKNGRIKFTNLDWEVEEGLLARHVGAKTARLINDYAALAFALPHLEDADTKTIGTVTKGFGDVHAVMGAGTGFGASVLVGGEFGPYCLSTESGHISFAPVNDYESEILRFLRKKHGRVTVEMLLSGPGLVNLYQAISSIRGEPAHELTPAQITHLDGDDATGSRYTVEAFLDIMASVCGDLALAHGAVSGMFIAGGIAPRLIKHIDELRFRARMEAKAPLAGLVASIPSHIIIHPYAALLGSANALTDVQITA